MSAVYRCPGDHAAWERLAASVGRHLGGVHVHFMAFKPDGSVLLEASDVAEAGQEYARDYVTRDTAPPLLRRLPAGRALWSHAVLSPEQLARCPVQNELLPRYGVGSRTWVHRATPEGVSMVATAIHAGARPGWTRARAAASSA